MELEHIDLDKYFEGLFKVSENTLKLRLLYEQLERLSLIKYELTKRLIFDSTNSIYIDRTLKVSEEINKMKSSITELENASISSDYVEKFLLITPSDKQDIEFLRNNSFDCEQEEFNNKIAVSSLNESEFINIYAPLLWNKISVYNKPFYETGNHILIIKGIDKDRVKIDLANDLGIYDFIIYLKNRLSELTAKPKAEKVTEEPTYEIVFNDKELFYELLKRLNRVDSSNKWIGLERQFFRVFIEQMKDYNIIKGYDSKVIYRALTPVLFGKCVETYRVPDDMQVRHYVKIIDKVYKDVMLTRKC